MKKLTYLSLLLSVFLASTGTTKAQDGKHSTTDILTIGKIEIIYPDDAKKGLKLTLSPNPTSEAVSIELPKKDSSGFDLKIVNASGQSLIAEKWNGIQVDVSSLPPGVYTVTLSKKDEIYTQKLVIVR